MGNVAEIIDKIFNGILMILSNYMTQGPDFQKILGKILSLA